MIHSLIRYFLSHKSYNLNRLVYLVSSKLLESFFLQIEDKQRPPKNGSDMINKIHNIFELVSDSRLMTRKDTIQDKALVYSKSQQIAVKNMLPVKIMQSIESTEQRRYKMFLILRT